MRTKTYLAVGILAVLAIGACSHESGRAASEAGGAVAALAPHAAPGAKQAFGRSADPAAGGGVASSSAHQASEALPLDDGTYKIRTADMTVAVNGARHVAVMADRAREIAEQAGGEVDSEDRTSGPQASATMRLLVPPDALDDTLAALSKLGTEKGRRLSTTDVTQKVADVDSRVRSASASIARLRLLFAHAKKIGAIIAIESELNSREADLESLEAQQRSLARQTSMATITLNLVTAHKAPAAPPKPDKDRSGFIGGLQRGWDGFTAAAVWVGEAVGTLLPFLVLALVLGIALRVLWPRLPGRQGPAPAPSPSE